MVAKKTTPRVEQLIAANYQGGMSIRQIAEVLDLSYDAARKALVRAGVSRREPKAPRIYSSRQDDIRSLYLSGRTTREIAAKLHLTQSTVSRYVARMKVMRGREESHRTR